MVLGSKESYDDWLEAFRDLRKRGLDDPVLGVTDGAPGLIRAFEEVFPKTLRQHCLVHKKRNILNKVPSGALPEVKNYLNSVYFAPDENCAKREREIFKEKFTSSYPSAIKCFDEDFAACIQHLKCPASHRKSITSTNLVERSFLEEKRRSNAIPRFFDEKSGLKLVFASLIRASQSWRRLKFTFEDEIEIMELREKMGHKAEKEQVVSKRSRKGSLVSNNFSRKNKT